MFTSKATPRFLAILVLSSVLLTGCAARSIPETKPPATPQAGVIDMDKAIKAHPKYQEWQKLKQQAATLNEQLAVEANRTAGAAQSLPALNMPGTAPDGLKQAIEQEYNAKMAAKQQELQARLAAKAQKIHGELSSELQAYAEQLDKKYQPRIFNLQLKLQTVRMDEKEAAAIKQEIDNVKAERADKLAAREKELAQNLDNALNPEKAAIEQELAAYAKQLNAELNNKMAAQSAAMAAGAAPPAPPPTASANSLEQELAMKQQEINVLEEYILNDIRDKAAKVAVERRLAAVLTGYKVNVSAVDITDPVIAAFKK